MGEGVCVFSGICPDDVAVSCGAWGEHARSWRVSPTARNQMFVGAVGGVIGNRLHIESGHLTAAFSGGEPLNVPTHDAFEFATR